MARMVRFRPASLVVILVGLVLLIQRPAPAAGTPAQKPSHVSQAIASSGPAGDVSIHGYVRPYFYPFMPMIGSFGWYGGYYSPFVSVPTLPPAYPYLPKYWWVEPYPSIDPRQAGYNPASGYPKEEVTTLLLVTYPAKTQIILDGIYVGTSDNLGPIQLPIGEHTLRMEAAGYEPSETVLKVEEPVLQQVEVRLKPAAPLPKSEKRP